jgi:hypothetical protein
MLFYGEKRTVPQARPSNRIGWYSRNWIWITCLLVLATTIFGATGRTDGHWANGNRDPELDLDQLIFAIVIESVVLMCRWASFITEEESSQNPKAWSRSWIAIRRAFIGVFVLLASYASWYSVLQHLPYFMHRPKLPQMEELLLCGFAYLLNIILVSYFVKFRMYFFGGLHLLYMACLFEYLVFRIHFVGPP